MRKAGSAEPCEGEPVACGACDLAALCAAHDAAGAAAPGDRRGRRARGFAANAHVIRAGQAAHAIYAVRQGVLKTVRVSPTGDERLVSFQMPGDVVGLEALGSARYGADVIALTPGALCELPLARLHRRLDDSPRLARALLRLLGRLASDAAFGSEHVRGPVRERVAGFLNDWSERLDRRGYDGRRFVLRMTRKDIASFLDMRLETISRTMRELEAEGCLRAERRRIELLPRIRAAVRAV